MPGSSNPNSGSFIPKRGPSRSRKPKSKNQIFIFSIITYSLLFAALLAAAGTYFYKNYLKSQLQTEVASLNTAITTFRVEDLARVSEFDVTLKRANNRVDNAASIVEIFAGIDAATVGPVQIDSLSILRNFDEGFTLTGTLLTDSFDAAMFQRKIYNANRTLFTDVVVEQVAIQNPETFGLETSGERQQVSFETVINVPLTEVLYDPTKARLQEADSVEPDIEPIVSPATTTDTLSETSI